MMNKGYRHLAAVSFGVLLLVTTLAAQAATAVAKVASVVGNADVKRAISGNTEPLRFKSEIFIDDTVITDLGSQVKLLLEDSSIIKVGPKSEMKIDKLLVGADDESNTTINLIKGRLRSIVGRKLGVTSSYEVRTSVAVAGVRGTIFDGLNIPAAENDTGRDISAFSTDEGLVNVGSTDPNIPDSVDVEPGNFTVVIEGEPPTAAEPITEGEDLEKKAKAKAKAKAPTSEEKDAKKEGKAEEKEDKTEAKTEGGTPGGDTENKPGTDAGTETGGNGSLERAESDAIPEMDLGDKSTLGQDVAEDVDPSGSVGNIVVTPELDHTNGNVLGTVLGGEDTSIGGGDQLDIVTQPPADGVSVPLQIVIPTP